MKWTKEKPKKKGWYWWCKQKRWYREIFWVFLDSGELYYQPYLGAEYRPVSDSRGLWSGPIPEPEE